MVDLRQKGALPTDGPLESPVLLTSAQSLYKDWSEITRLPPLEQSRARQNLLGKIRPNVPIAMEESNWHYLSYGLYDF